MVDSNDLEFIDLSDFDRINREDEKKPNIVESLKRIAERFAVFTGLLVFLETVFHIWAIHSFDANFFMKLLMTLPSAAFLSLFTSFFGKKANKVITWVISVILLIYYAVNVIYHTVFKVYFSVAFISKNNAKIYQYYREILEAMGRDWLVLLILIIIPVAALILLNRFEIIKYEKAGLVHIYVGITLLAVTILCESFVALAYGKDALSPYELMVVENDNDTSFKKLGVLATAEVEVKFNLFPNDELDDSDKLGDVWVYDGNNTSADETETSGPSEPAEEVADVSSDEEIAAYEAYLEEQAHKIDTSPNMLDIDFVSLAENETDEYVAGIHNYMSTLVPTNKNEYTGMFKGFNLIFLTAEGFSDIAVDEVHTPTLYKMIHEGFYFTNFYNPRTGGSTSDGEFVCSTSLYPMKGGATNFKRVGRHSMPFALGNLFNRTYGITSRAYHDNDYEYYGRDITYPGMGYYYQGVGNGLEIEKHWPASDLQMMEASLPEYIDDDIFNVYYMTVSGHLNYNFTGNWCSKKHREEVQDLDVSEPCQAYVACQMELDLAMQYLIEQLEEKGIADRTVICFTGDHWPYGLSNEEFSELLGHPVEENFELYKSNLILWSGAIKEPIVIDKPCCSMDILPTLLNLFGFEYDSRLLMGYDILSDTEGFVAMWNKSIITETLMYNSQTGEVTYLTEDGEPPEEMPEDYLDNLKTKLALKRKYSERIIDYDYYKYIADALGIQIDIPEQNYTPDYSKFTP
ncbi:MAG: LTA synthase family protein [Lachnospiraceae bacterium]|nr:LTA synthase family protein [Lachnospiraceae bacterium]